jgi:hypothetical protein
MNNQPGSQWAIGLFPSAGAPVGNTAVGLQGCTISPVNLGAAPVPGSPTPGPEPRAGRGGAQPVAGMPLEIQWFGCVAG